MTAALLIERLTEELPPKALARLGESFAATIVDGLRAQGLAPAGGACAAFATPRRLAVRVADVRERADDRAVEVKGPSVAVALDAQAWLLIAALGAATFVAVDLEKAVWRRLGILRM